MAMHELNCLLGYDVLRGCAYVRALAKEKCCMKVILIIRDVQLVLDMELGVS